jgi:hypothetical protein
VYACACMCMGLAFSGWIDGGIRAPMRVSASRMAIVPGDNYIVFNLNCVKFGLDDASLERLALVTA